MILKFNDAKIRLKNVLYVPDINMNLLSVIKITDQECNVKFDKHEVIIYRNKEIKMTTVREENAYYVKLSTIRKETIVATKDVDIWYNRLGHTNKRIIEEMKKEDLVIGMNEMNKEKRQCEPCGRKNV